MTIRAGFKPATPEKIATNGDPERKGSLQRQGSLQRIKEALVRSGSVASKNSIHNAASQNANKPLSQFDNNVDAGDQSVGGGGGGGQSVQNQPKPNDVLGKRID